MCCPELFTFVQNYIIFLALWSDIKKGNSKSPIWKSIFFVRIRVIWLECITRGEQVLILGDCSMMGDVWSGSRIEFLAATSGSQKDIQVSVVLTV